jgi:transcriptional regulator with XRE-family HTH domain
MQCRYHIVMVKHNQSWSEGVILTEDEKRSSRPERPEGYGELRRIVAANIRTERLRHGWSLDTVANRLAIYLGLMGASTISAWENSRHDGAKGFTVEELYALCHVFKLTLAELLYPPTLLDMPPIEKLPGEDSGTDLAALFRKDDHASTADMWHRYEAKEKGRYYGPDEAPF